MGGVDVPQGEHQEPAETHPEQHHCKHLNGFDLFSGASTTRKCCRLLGLVSMAAIPKKWQTRQKAVT